MALQRVPEAALLGPSSLEVSGFRSWTVQRRSRAARLSGFESQPCLVTLGEWLAGCLVPQVTGGERGMSFGCVLAERIRAKVFETAWEGGLYVLAMLSAVTAALWSALCLQFAR